MTYEIENDVDISPDGSVWSDEIFLSEVSFNSSST